VKPLLSLRAVGFINHSYYKREFLTRVYGKGCRHFEIAS
jgi:hypothetical protein